MHGRPHRWMVTRKVAELLLLEKGADVNAQGEEHIIALHIVARSGEV